MLEEPVKVSPSDIPKGFRLRTWDHCRSKMLTVQRCDIAQYEYAELYPATCTAYLSYPYPDCVEVMVTPSTGIELVRLLGSTLIEVNGQRVNRTERRLQKAFETSGEYVLLYIHKCTHRCVRVGGRRVK